MTDTQTPLTDDNTVADDNIVASEIVADTKPQDRFNHVWWIPLIALLIVSYLAVNHFTTQGPLVTITFSNAEGLEINKTKVRYKDVVIGQVETISLTSDYKGIQVSVRMDKDSEGLLRENTRFWVVKPRIGITQISGLNTLLSGNYITVEPDNNPDSAFRYHFQGLEMPPIVRQDEPGLKITLLSSKASSLYPGTAVYYKGMVVGTVNRVYFSDDYLWVKADVFIAAPHDQLIKSTTKFWSSSGISIEANTDGVEVAMESIETLISGGITFETPISLVSELEQDVDDGSEFILFSNYKAAEDQNIGRKHYFVTYFNGSIKGLDVNAPVMIQGINIGRVKDIRLLFDPENTVTRIPVLFEVYENRLNWIINKPTQSDDGNSTSNFDIVRTNNNQETEELLKRFVQAGLRTQLETGNLLTGTKYVSLVFSESARQGDNTNVEPMDLEIDPITGYTMLPSTLQSFDAITAGIGNIVNKVNNLPLDDIADNLNTLLMETNHTLSELSLDKTMARIDQLLTNAGDKINQLAIDETVNEINALIREGTTLSKTAKSTLNSLNQSVRELVESTETAMSGYSADAPLYYNLNRTLEQLNETMESLKTFTDMLDRSPNALIFGEKRPQ